MQGKQQYAKNNGVKRTMEKAVGVALLMLLFVGAGAPMLAQAVEVQSLRGSLAPNEPATVPEQKRWNKDGEPLDRAYMQQPPLIPHQIKGYRVNLKSNKCLSCHSWANARNSGAPRISQTHFDDRDGNSLANVSPRRYFCNQCHVPQVNARPLVVNTFEPVEGITGH